MVDVSLTVSPIRSADGVILGASKIARDITERRRLDRLREELLDRERAARAEAVAARERLSFLAEVSAILTSSLDYEETLDRRPREDRAAGDGVGARRSGQHQPS